MSGFSLKLSYGALFPVLNSSKISFYYYLAGLIEGDGSIKVPESER